MASGSMLTILLCVLVPSIAAEESCALSGNCFESVEFESDSGLGLLQSKVRAHRAVAARRGDGAVPFAKDATNAEFAENAEYAENARTAAMARNAFAAQNARVAAVATKALFAEEALEADRACHVDASLGDDTKKDDNDNDGADEDPYSKECGGSSDATAVSGATDARCAGTAENARNAFNAMFAVNAIEADNASNALFANQAEFTDFAKEAGFAIRAKTRKASATQEECEGYELGNPPAWSETDAVPCATNATNAIYAEWAEFSENAKTAGFAENAFGAENARSAEVGTKVLFAQYASKAGSACHVDATLDDSSKKDEDEWAEFSKNADKGADEEPSFSACDDCKSATISADATNAKCAEASQNAFNASNAIATKNAVEAANATNAVFADNAMFAEYAKEADKAIVAQSADHILPATVCAEMGSGLSANNLVKLKSKLQQQADARRTKGTKKLTKKRIEAIAKLGIKKPLVKKTTA